MDALDTLLAQKDNALFQLQATCTDTRSFGGTYWQASIILNEEPDMDDPEGEGKNLTTLNLFIEPSEDGNTLAKRYTLDYEVNEVGVNDRISLVSQGNISAQKAMDWFKLHHKTYDLDDIILPVAAKFFLQTEPLLA